jgi:cytosine/adenosine deaminase-related metal-dependent hydrolase
MPQMLITCRTIVTMDPARRIVQDGALLVRDDRIERVLNREECERLAPFDGELVNGRSLVAIPGFVQTHVHLCQTLFRGLADDLALLDWLRTRIFPFEHAHSSSSMYASARIGLAELIRSGTTTIMDMGSIHYEEEVIRAVDESGIRAFVGKALMDINDTFSPLRESTGDALASTVRLAEAWHRASGGRIRYAVAPRFVLSCTDALLKEAHAITRSLPGVLFHTHAAENRQEMESVRNRCGMGNVEFFDRIGILDDNSCLAHCIWLSDREMDILASRKAKVLHCPSSNLKLGSGIARVPEMLHKRIPVSLGADGAPCNNTLDMFQEMRHAALIQKPLHGAESMSARTVFELATLGGAAALGLEDELGSLEPGKKADIVLLDLDQSWNPFGGTEEMIYSSCVYSGSPSNVHSVMVDGRWLFRDGVLRTFDEQETNRGARKEARALLERISV